MMMSDDAMQCMMNAEPNSNDGELEPPTCPSQPTPRPGQPPPQPASSRGAPHSKADDDDSYKAAYSGFTYEPIPSTGRPGSPHRFFSESYIVRRRAPEENGSQCSSETARQQLLPVLHKSANGLVVVTTPAAGMAAQAFDNGSSGMALTTSALSGIDVLVSEAPVDSQGGKRKKQAKMLKGKSVQHVVRPGDTLAVLHFVSDDSGSSTERCRGDELLQPGQDDESSGRTKSLLCGVWGTILEINPNLTPELVRTDPALNGYVAIVLPTGPFPPPAGARA